MPDAARPPDLTIEEHLRAAQGVLLLIAEIVELHSRTPDGSGPGFSAAASATDPPWVGVDKNLGDYSHGRGTRRW